MEIIGFAGIFKAFQTLIVINNAFMFYKKSFLLKKRIIYMKKAKNLFLLIVLILASAFNFGVLSHKIGQNTAYAQKSTGCGATTSSAECRSFGGSFKVCWSYLGQPNLHCTK